MALAKHMVSTPTLVVVFALLVGVPLVGLAARAATRTSDGAFSTSIPSRQIALGANRFTIYYDPANFKIPERDIEE